MRKTPTFSFTTPVSPTRIEIGIGLGQLDPHKIRSMEYGG